MAAKGNRENTGEKTAFNRLAVFIKPCPEQSTHTPNEEHTLHIHTAHNIVSIQYSLLALEIANRTTTGELNYLVNQSNKMRWLELGSGLDLEESILPIKKKNLIIDIHYNSYSYIIRFKNYVAIYKASTLDSQKKGKYFSIEKKQNKMNLKWFFLVHIQYSQSHVW